MTVPIVEETAIETASAAVLDRLLVERGGLRAFTKIVWPQIDPAPFVPGWHIEEVCQHLEAVTVGAIRNLIINIPPGFSKSSIVSVIWPAWAWTLDPEKKWICVSHDPKLSLRDGRRMRNLIQSPWWQARWPHVEIDDQGSTSWGDFDNTAKGFRISVGTGQKITGRHADIKVVDDPHKPSDLQGAAEVSRARLQQTIDWWNGMFGSRDVDVLKTRTVLIMQRLHQHDLTGYLLERGEAGTGEQYEQLRLPMEYEAALPCRTSVGGDRRTHEGELLCPARVGPEALVIGKLKLGDDVTVAAQWQQRPMPKGGNIIKADWIRHWGDPAGDYPKHPPLSDMRLEQSWDCTFKGSATSDYVWGQVWGYYLNKAFLLDQVRGQFSFIETLDAFRRLSAKWPTAWVKKIEDKANGTAVANVLQAEIVGIELVNPEGPKDERLKAVSPLFRAGVVYLPPVGYPHVRELVNELINFPAAAHDDGVDTASQALLELAKGSRLELLKAANDAMKRASR